MFTAWWFPFSRFGVIHGDPHLGNYTVFEEDGEPARHQPARLWLHPHLPAELRRRRGRSLSRAARRRRRRWWCTPTRPGASSGSSRELIDILNIWARFIYGPLLDDRVRSIADGVKPAEYGRREAFRVHQALKEKGPVTVPREFVFMDRAAIGLGGVFLHLRAELNFYRLFNEAIENFSVARGRPSGRPAALAEGRARERRMPSRWPSISQAYGARRCPRRRNCGNPACRRFWHLGTAQWPTTARSNTRPRTATTTASTSSTYQMFLTPDEMGHHRFVVRRS